MMPHLLQPAAALPADAATTLLAPAEAATYAALKVPKRRSDWLLGRITAKQLVAAHLAIAGLRLDEIVIAADADGAPFASLHGERLPLSLSISHSHATAFCALVDEPSATVGADIEYIEPRDPAFLRDYFTPEEQAGGAGMAAARGGDNAALERQGSGAKSLREGLRIDTRQVQIALPQTLGDEWTTFAITLHPALAVRFPGAYTGWARHHDAFVLTVALRTI